MVNTEENGEKAAEQRAGGADTNGGKPGDARASDTRGFLSFLKLSVFAEVSAMLAILAAATYVLGLFALWVPISRTFTQDFVSAWYAVSLVPRIVVAGLGVQQLVAFLLFITIVLFIGILVVEVVLRKLTALYDYIFYGSSFEREYEREIRIPTPSLLTNLLLVVIVSLYAGWRIDAGLTSSAPHLSPLSMALVIFIIFTSMASVIQLILLIVRWPATARKNLRPPYNKQMLKGYLLFHKRDTIVLLVIPITGLVALYFTWRWAIGPAPLAQQLQAIGFATFANTVGVLAAAWFAGGGANLAALFLVTGLTEDRRKNFQRALAVLAATAFTVAFLLTVTNKPPLPTVTMQPPLPAKPSSNSQSAEGHLLTHNEGTWYVFNQSGNLVAIPDDKVEAAWVSAEDE